MLGKPRGRTTLLPILLFLLCSPYLLHFAVRNAEADSATLVRNVNTGLSYVSIQAAIDAQETADGHTLLVDPGVYPEHVEVYKSLRISGSGAETTIIDGSGIGTVVYVNASNVFFSGFAVRNGGNSSVDFLNSGIFVDYSENVTLSNNKVTSCRYGIYLFHSADNRLIDNRVLANYEDGIWLYYSGSNTLERNAMLGNRYNFGVFGQSFADFNNTVEESNVVDGKPIRYEIGVSDKVFDSGMEAGTLYLINANNVTVRDLHLSGNGNGVFLWNATNSKVENLTASGNNYGIFLQNSNGNSVLGNSCPDNWVGIFLESSNHNSVKGNSAPANEKGISLYESSESSLEGNTVSDNLYGIRLFSSSSNKMWHNNVIENTHQIDLVNSYNNDLDDGSEGNFWSDHAGIDANEDGIGDSAHYVDGEQDRYPLMGRFYEFSVSSERGEFRVPIICSSLITHLSSETTGEGNGRVISFDVTGELEKQGFCRMSIPVALLRDPYTVEVFDSSWSNITPSALPSADDAWALLYFSYSSRVELIVVSGIEPSPDQRLEPYVAVVLGAAIASAFLGLYLVARKRRREPGPSSDA